MMSLMQDTQWNMQPNQPKAIMLAKRQLAELVFDAVNLEGIAMTLPEVQTLLDGITVGGHRISDQQITINQAEAWKKVFAWAQDGHFVVSAQKACGLHAIAAKDEALEWGRFRSGGVTIAGTGYLPPDASDLPRFFDRMVTEMTSMHDIYDQAIFVFLTMARTQFFYDVNKRMGRFMMNGILLQAGYPVVNLPAKRQLGFNQLMLDFYDSNDQKPMNEFLRSCLSEQVVKIMKEG